jgi:hypothetical protein
MSLDGLVAEVGRTLGDARELYGPAPRSSGWASTAGLRRGRDGIAHGGGVVPGWDGAGSRTQRAAGGARIIAVDNVIGADETTGPNLGTGAETSRAGRTGMNGVVDDTRRGVTAIAPSTDTPAGKRQLVDHLQAQLDRAKAQLRVSEQRNVLLAQAIRQGAGGYGAGPRMGGQMGGMSGMGGMGSMPSFGGGGGGGMPSGMSMPNLSALTNLARTGRGRPAGLHNMPGAPPHAGAAGPLPQMAVNAALGKLGTPYIWGAKGPSNFDCSGLTQWAWGQAGVTIGPDTYTQIKQGVATSPEDVQPGDLIFPHAGHVQMALSKDTVVHAPTPGDVVRTAPMPKQILAIRRPIAG